jgi:hypothetical protein
MSLSVKFSIRRNYLPKPLLQYGKFSFSISDVLEMLFEVSRFRLCVPKAFGMLLQTKQSVFSGLRLLRLMPMKDNSQRRKNYDIPKPFL